MTDAQGLAHDFERIEPGEGRRTLRVRLAADGTNFAELQHLHQKCTNWAEHMRNGRLPRHLAWRSLRTILWPQLLYPRPVTTFSSADCRHIMSPVLKVGLSASGIVRMFPRALTHGPPDAFGLGVWDLYNAQGWAHISIVIGMTLIWEV